MYKDEWIIDFALGCTYAVRTEKGLRFVEKERKKVKNDGGNKPLDDIAEHTR